MKKQIIPAVIILVLAIVIAVGAQSFLSPCVHEDGTFGACHWAGQTVTALGLMLGVMAALGLCIRAARPGLYLGSAAASLLGILTPGVIIDLCRMSTMRCRMVMQPAMIILFSAALLCALLGALFTLKGKSK